MERGDLWMNSLKRLLSLVTALSLSYSVVCAQESITNGSEPNLGINVVSRNGGEISTIYSGSPEGYAGGLYSDIDFSDIQFMVVFKWGDEGDDDETVYIFPNKDQSASSINSALQQNPALDDTTGQQNVLNNSNAEITTNMLLVYDNIYHENVILPGKTLTIPVTVSNSGSEAKQLISYIAQYDLNGRLTDLTQGDIITAMPNQTVTASVSDNFSVDTACTAKVFVWEKDTMAPVSDSITLTLQNQDYFPIHTAERRQSNLIKSYAA